jgi:hypothetical protein
MDYVHQEYPKYVRLTEDEEGVLVANEDEELELLGDEKPVEKPKK